MYSEDFPSSRVLLIVLIVGVMLASTAPLLFTGYFFTTSFNFSETGPIGDTIAGTTAPILSILGSLLIFFSFRAQINANKIQRQQLVEAEKQSQFDLVYRLVNDIKADINYFSYPIGNISPERGIAAFNRFSDHLSRNYRESKVVEPHVEINATLGIVFSMKYTIDLLDGMKLSQSDRDLLLAPLAITYRTKLLDPLLRLSTAWKENGRERSNNRTMEKIVQINDFLSTKMLRHE